MRNQTVLVATLTATLGMMPAFGQWRTTTNTSPNASQGQPRPGQNNQGPDDQQGPDDRHRDAGVARVSVADGDVELQRGDSGDRMQARGGMPMMGNDSISTGRSSRAEVQLGPGNLVRLSEDTRLRVVDVGNRYFRIEVLTGTINISQMKGSEADIDVMAPNTTVRPLKAGVYRVSVREGMQTDLTVRKGEAEIVSSRGGEKVKSDHRASVRGDRQNAEYRVSDAEPKDSFDRWNERRDDVLEPRVRGGGLMFGGGYGYGGYGGYGPYGGFGYPYWGPGYFGGYGGGLGFYGPSIIVGGRIGGFGGGYGRGGGGRGRR